MKRSFLLVVGVVLASLINTTTFAACPSADLTGDCKVNLKDFAVIGDSWSDQALLFLRIATAPIPNSRSVAGSGISVMLMFSHVGS